MGSLKRGDFVRKHCECIAVVVGNSDTVRWWSVKLVHKCDRHHSPDDLGITPSSCYYLAGEIRRDACRMYVNDDGPEILDPLAISLNIQFGDGEYAPPLSVA